MGLLKRAWVISHAWILTCHTWILTSPKTLAEVAESHHTCAYIDESCHANKLQHTLIQAGMDKVSHTNESQHQVHLWRLQSHVIRVRIWMSHVTRISHGTHTYRRVWISHDTHTYRRVWISYVTQMNHDTKFTCGGCRPTSHICLYGWVMSREWVTAHTHTCEYESVTSREWVTTPQSRVEVAELPTTLAYIYKSCHTNDSRHTLIQASMNQLRYTYESVTSHIGISYVTRTKGSPAPKSLCGCCSTPPPMSETATVHLGKYMNMWIWMYIRTYIHIYTRTATVHLGQYMNI